jgi:hypothetical protein
MMLTLKSKAVGTILQQNRKRKLYPESRTREAMPEGFIQMGDLINRLRWPVQTDYVPGRRYLFDALPDGSWSGQPCFIVGGGPSLTGFDFESLRAHRVIAINRVYENLPFADILFAIDPTYYQNCRTGKVGKDRAEMLSVFQKWTLFTGFKVWLDTNRTNYGDVHLLPHGPLYEEPPYKNAMKDGIATGNFSGYAAVNLAMCLGANPIYLLGFDCKHDGSRTHYHSGYERTAEETKLKQLAQDFTKLKRKADALGVKIVNLTPGSAIQAFPKGDASKVLRAEPKGAARGWVAISFYTKGTSYEQEVLKLEASLKKFNLPYHFFGCEQFGSWRLNLNCKSAAILEAFKRFPEHDIVFIDADAVVKKHPELFDRLSAKRLHNMAAHFHVYPQSVPGGSLLSGTLWFRNCPETIELVRLWHKIGLEHPEIRHQHCLRLAIEEWRRSGRKVNVFRMPREYTCIFDYRGNRGADPVIEHFQASRRLKQEVGRGPRLLDSNFLTLPRVGHA